ncbi:MAG: NAD-dependent epimerase/dehydratase family protein [Lentisphaeria bacterium]
MKKILITGANSYIGTSFENYIKQWQDDYSVETLDLLDSNWQNFDFSPYHCVFHVAGIAHSDNGKISEQKAKLYYEINTDLTLKIANIAKVAGVSQFIFMSSAIVFGASSPIGKNKIITKDTIPNPENSYGDSKLQAEIGLLLLNDDNFKIVILRPPMIYGKNCKGNFPLLRKIALSFPVFPNIHNQRSMIFIDNLLLFIKLLIKNDEQGIFHPQNPDFSNTSQIVKMIASENHKNLFLIPGFELALKIIRPIFPHIDKAFGNFSYDQSLSYYKEFYQKISISQSIEIIEAK